MKTSEKRVRHLDSIEGSQVDGRERERERKRKDASKYQSINHNWKSFLSLSTRPRISFDTRRRAFSFLLSCTRVARRIDEIGSDWPLIANRGLHLASKEKRIHWSQHFHSRHSMELESPSRFCSTSLRLRRESFDFYLSTFFVLSSFPERLSLRPLSSPSLHQLDLICFIIYSSQKHSL